MEAKPDKNKTIGSELRFAFIPIKRDNAEEEFHQSPVDFELPILVICSGMKPNYHGRRRSDVKELKAKKELVLRGELVQASDHELYVFVGIVGSAYALTSEKQVLSLDAWCPKHLRWLFESPGTVRAVLWSGGKELWFEVSCR